MKERSPWLLPNSQYPLLFASKRLSRDAHSAPVNLVVVAGIND